jgi:uncharacterized protein
MPFVELGRPHAARADHRARSAMRVAVVLSLMLCSACSALLGTRRDPPKLYVLSATPAATTHTLPAAAVLGLGPIDLPGYLDRRGIVTRVAPNRVEASANDLWAEPLATNFKTVLEQNLRLRMPGVPIRTYPWVQGATPELAVAIEVVQFEATSGGTIELLARWALREPRERTVVVSRDSVLTQAVAGPGTEDVIAAMSSVLGTLADQIAAEIATRAPAAAADANARARRR